MKKIFNISILSLMFLVIGCQNGITEPFGLSDAEIVEMIIESNKVEISMDEMPQSSQSIVQEEYLTFMGMASRKASGLGYEVELAGLGHHSGRRNELYFNLEGRKLDPNNWGKKGRDFKGDWSRDDKGDWSCFELAFPVSFDMPDGSVIVVNSDDEDGWSEIKTWYEANSDSREKPSMQYPVVIFLDDESITLSNDEELRGAYAECNFDRRKNRDGHERKEPCFELVYPVTYIMPDGSNITIDENDEGGWVELKNWYSENDGFEETKPELQYPVSIIYDEVEENITVIINSEEEMMAAKEECREEWEEGYKRECFELEFPVQFLMPDGSIITLDNEEGYMNIRNWYLENPESEQEALMQYPVEIVYETELGDSSVVINSEEAMATAKEACYDEWEEYEEEWEGDDEWDEGDECYAFIYPISFTMPDGTTLTLENEDGFRELEFWYESNAGFEEEPSFQFPIEIIVRDDQGQSVFTINTEDELESAEENCED
jgi:hypothetical protein